MAESTRERVWRELRERYPSERLQINAWMALDFIPMIPPEEWRAMHARTCVSCGSPDGRLYATGEFCAEHAPDCGVPNA